MRFASAKSVSGLGLKSSALASSSAFWSSSIFFSAVSTRRFSSLSRGAIFARYAARCCRSYFGERRTSEDSRAASRGAACPPRTGRAASPAFFSQ